MVFASQTFHFNSWFDALIGKSHVCKKWSPGWKELPQICHLHRNSFRQTLANPMFVFSGTWMMSYEWMIDDFPIYLTRYDDAMIWMMVYRKVDLAMSLFTAQKAQSRSTEFPPQLMALFWGGMMTLLLVEFLNVYFWNIWTALWRWIRMMWNHDRSGWMIAVNCFFFQTYLGISWYLVFFWFFVPCCACVDVPRSLIVFLANQAAELRLLSGGGKLVFGLMKKIGFFMLFGFFSCFLVSFLHLFGSFGFIFFIFFTRFLLHAGPEAAQRAILGPSWHELLHQ